MDDGHNLNSRDQPANYTPRQSYDGSYPPQYSPSQPQRAQYGQQSPPLQGQYAGQQQQAPPANGFNDFGMYSNIFNDPNAQLGAAVGRNALNYGRDYVSRHIPQSMQVSVLKYYFQVSNYYVLYKIGLVLFPWRHKSWTRKLQRSEITGASDSYATARDDINAPDMYIPYMAFTTYILLNCVLAGVKGSFHPQLIQSFISSTMAYILIELLLLKLGTYLLSADSKLLDFFAYSGYKFIGIIVTTLFYSVMPWSMVKWPLFFYTASSNSFFLLRSLRYVLLPDSSAVNSSTHTINPAQRQRRIQFLFVYSFVCQFILMWLLL